MPATVTSITPTRAGGPPPRLPARRPFRDNPRLILAGIAVLVSVLVAILAVANRTPRPAPGLPERGRPLCAVGRRPDDACGAGVRPGAQHRQADRRAAAGPAVCPVPGQARRAPARHDGGACSARPRRRQRADSRERRSVVQCADGRGAVVREQDCRRLLPRAASSRQRSRGPPCPRPVRGRPLPGRGSSDSRPRHPRRHAAARQDGAGAASHIGRRRPSACRAGG